LPERTLLRVLRLARFDGLSVLFVAGFFALLSALAGDRLGAIVGLLIAGAGAVELHGATLLLHGENRGMSWLISSQLLLMLTVLAYCQYGIGHINLAFWHTALEPAQAQIKAQGQTIDEVAVSMNRLAYMLVAIATVLYQGGMTIYYVRRRAAVAQALTEYTAE
jgi:hypothetical protein